MYVVGYRPDPIEVGLPIYDQAAIRRLDPRGQLVWERTWQGSPDGDDVALDVAVDPAGNAIVVGRMATASHGSDAWIAAYARDGALLWSDQRGTDGDDAAVAVAVAADGSFAVVGSQAGVAWIARYDADRQPVSELSSAQIATWQSAAFAASGDLVVTGGDQTGRYTAELGPVWTRSYRDLRANDVAVDHAGNVVVVGSVAGDIAIVKYRQ
jgi:hypothetical protein